MQYTGPSGFATTCGGKAPVLRNAPILLPSVEDSDTVQSADAAMITAFRDVSGGLGRPELAQGAFEASPEKGR